LEALPNDPGEEGVWEVLLAFIRLTGGYIAFVPGGDVVWDRKVSTLYR
jgi:hypothetical protein